VEEKKLTDPFARQRETTSGRQRPRSIYSRKCPSRFWLNKSWSRLVAGQIWCPLHQAGDRKNFATISGVRQFHCPRTGVQENGHCERELSMDECVYCRLRRGDSGLVASKLPISGTGRCDRGSHGTKWKFVLLLLGCGLFVSGCAHDSGDDSGGAHRHHRHGDGHAREKMETVDRSDSSSPTPALGW
jgi:hypothetical protein